MLVIYFGSCSVYTNDLLAAPKHCQSACYVDDSKLCLKFKTCELYNAVSAVTSDLNEICIWCCHNSLLLNPDKTKLLVVGVPQLLNSVKELIDKYSFDILALLETWLTSEICDNEISIKGYSIVRKDRQDSSNVCGGGVLIYIRDGIPFIRQTDFVDDNFECLGIQINRRFCKPMAVSVVYRPGFFNIEDFTNALTRILDNTDLDKVETIILGDFNVDYSAKKNPLRPRLDEFAFSFNLTQIISKPTRVTETSNSTIDLILVNNTHKIVQCDVLDSSISDHNVIFCVVKGGVKKLPPKVFEYQSFKSYEKKAFIKDLEQVLWSIIEGVGDIDDTVFLWEKLFRDCADHHAPIKSRRVKGMPTPWVSVRLLELRRNRDFHRRKALSSNSQYHWRMYRKLRNFASREEKSLKSQYYWKLIEDAKNDSSSMWKAMKQTLPSNHMDTNAIFSNGKLHTSFIDIAEHLNQHFSNIAKYLAKVFRNTSSALSKNVTSAYDFKLNPISEMIVHRELSKMKANKAIGLDKISARLLRDAAWVIAPSLTYIINSSLKLGKFPSRWKCAKVTALFKQGDRTIMDNYRPISVLPTVSKVIEKAAHIQLYAFLESHHLLVTNQFGFRRGRSTPLALTQFTDEMLTNMDNGLLNRVIFLDLKKAFDTVDHTILIHKLKIMGVSGVSLAWFQSYLTSRFQRTVIGQATSCNRRVYSWSAPFLYLYQ